MFHVKLVFVLSIASVSFCCKPALVDVADKIEKIEETERKATFQYCPPYSREDAGNFEFSMPPPKDSFKKFEKKADNHRTLLGT